MTLTDKTIEALRSLVAALAHKAAADRHGTAEQSQETQAIVDNATSVAWQALAEFDSNAMPNAPVAAWRTK